MNYQESQIANFESCNAGVPRHLALSALVAAFTEGWDADALSELTTKEEVRACPDWALLTESVAWPYSDEDEVIAAILDQWIL